MWKPSREAAWITLLGVGELVDIATTRFGLAIGTHEANPIAVQLLDHGLMEIIKVGVVAMAVVVQTSSSLVIAFAQLSAPKRNLNAIRTRT